LVIFGTQEAFERKNLRNALNSKQPPLLKTPYNLLHSHIDKRVLLPVEN
jgi:hypothetical protein